jgi:hypothetical protein
MNSFSLEFLQELLPITQANAEERWYLFHFDIGEDFDLTVQQIPVFVWVFVQHLNLPTAAQWAQ